MSRTVRQRHVHHDKWIEESGRPSWLKDRDHTCYACADGWSKDERRSGDRRKRYRTSEQRHLQ